MLEDYQRIMVGLNISNKDILLKNIKIYCVAFILYNLAFLIFFIKLLLYESYHYPPYFYEPYLSLSVLIIILFSLIISLMVYSKENKIDGWKMKSGENAYVICKYPLLIIILIIGITFLWKGVISTDLPYKVSGLILGIFIISLSIIANFLRSGFGIEKNVKRRYDIKNLRHEIYIRIKIKYPEAHLKWKYIKVNGLKVWVSNINGAYIVGTVRIMNINEKNLSMAKEIMEIVNLLG